MAKQMQLISYGVNCLGTMSFTIQFSKMRKSESFSVYPINEQTRVLMFQSAHRWAELNLDTKQFEVSCSRTQYANSVHFQLSRNAGKNFIDQCTDEQFDLIVNAIKGTASPNAGSGVIHCDNSFAANI